MGKTLSLLVALLKDRRGITSVEYALVAGALAAVILTGFAAFGTRVKDFMTTITL